MKKQYDIYNKKTYYYDLPQELIAQTPIQPRDHSRMLVYDRKDGSINHKHFYDVIDYLNEGDVLVINNTKVIPARLIGYKQETGAKIEVFLLKKLNLNKWQVLLKPQKKAKIGAKIVFNEELSCTVLSHKEMGIGEVEFEYDGVFEDVLSRVGNMPLPPYIHEKLKDKDRYQTVYNKVSGSSAAPTAGLHFTNELLEKIKQKGVIIAPILLHVGLGTFRPVNEDNILNHDMHTEYYEISENTANIINTAKKENRKIIAVGTTSVRTLESASYIDENGVTQVRAEKKETNIFIYPGYKFKVIDHLITNFHLPESTLIMLVSAFCGIEETLNFYSEAVKEKYRFFSFGDSCLLL